jgi:hypothetical protein
VSVAATSAATGSQAVPWKAASRPMHTDVTAVVILAAITISPTRALQAATA